ncbi:uncharacterized protein LOC110737933 [Chenopodium quinoa]|uniref:uncharacterized protein LOC110737933 n=1 Tax=Chenopodium quinoa TaxID=63459 RepID=UPI000B798510|nr:uncharacterized protein LOC110737933 [Chenopodium quinoa]
MGEADLWWQQNKTTIKALPSFNWTLFQVKVRDKFYPNFLQKHKAEEFSNLAIGYMSVTEYYTKFIELSIFSKESIAIEKEKARKFESGLTTNLQLKLCGQVFETLDEFYGRSRHTTTTSTATITSTTTVIKVFNGEPKNSNQRNYKGPRHFYCKRCRNDHPGKDCEGNLVTCRACNKLGHRECECFSKDSNRNKQGNNQGGAQKNFQRNNNYSGNKGAQQYGVKSKNNGNNQVKSGAPGKLNVISRHKADTTKDVITSTFSINSIPIKVLFDSGATFSFISKATISKLSHCLKTIDVIDVHIVIPTGGVAQCTKTIKYVPLEIKGNVFLSDLIEFGLIEFNVILGMDWLSKYSAEIRCRSQKVQLSTAEGELVTHWKHGETKCPRIISMNMLAKYIKKGHPVYFCSVTNLEHEETARPENIEVVNEFLDVFPEEIPRMPPNRAIDFTIELVPGTTPISKALYRMTPA